jgi:hypothetical protein
MSNISDKTTLTNAMYNHIDKVMGHWKGKIYAWDVVNEAFNEDGTYRSSIWTQRIGNNFIDLAFQRARQADPDAKLIYNDYNIEPIGAKSNGMYNMIKSMKERGIPIDGVGFQMHLTDGGLDYQSFADNMARLADLGLELYITEMDVRMPDSNRDLQKQATIYSEVLKRCVAQPACKGVQVWGIVDKYSWVMSTFPGTGVPLLFDDSYNAKPAYYSVQTVLATLSNSTPGPTAVPTAVPTQGPTPVPGTISIACGSSSAVGNFQADQYYSGGSTYNNTNTIDVSGITSNPPPAALFNNERYGAMSYTIPGFTAGNSYSVTLYFAETYLTSAGSRLFGVSINGTSVLSNFDIYASAGGQNKAIAQSFSTAADSSGQIVIQFTSGTENPKINGISIIPASGPTAVPTVAPTATPGPGSVTVFISPSSQTVNQGGTVTVEIHMNTTSDMGAFGFTVTYPSNLLTFGSIAEIASGLNLTNNTGTAGQIVTAGFNANGIAGGSDVALIRITFTASSSATGSGAIGLTVNTFADSSGTTLSTTANGGTVSVQQGANLGDVNDDGSVTIVDALLIAQYFVGLDPAGFIQANADVNCSGSIDIVDALVVAQYYVGLISSFPC